jgi:23S rRNA pseudouridine2605 synthase
MQERLQKLISRAGVASRRKAEELIQAGLVSVDGEIVTELGSKADPAVQAIKVRGKPLLQRPPTPIYLALNKPKAYITTTDDPEGRRTVMDLLGRYRSKVYPIGRLDYASEGLLLFTNDGDFANLISSAKSEIAKTYEVKVNRTLSASQMDRFRSGLVIDGRPTAPARMRLLRAAANPWYQVTLVEGRNRQLRKMFLALGVLVEKIKRTRVGPLALGKLPPGHFRELTDQEVERFLKGREQPRNQKEDAKRPTNPRAARKRQDDRRRRAV